jgi:transcriptional regulator with XRE-family HTH domain
VHGFRARPQDIGSARARELATRIGRELRIARVGAGLTQSKLAALAGMSQSMVAESERGLPGVSLDARCRLAAACGHELSMKLFPVSTLRLRDSGQLTLARAVVEAAARCWRSRFEMPTGPGQLHAADIVLENDHQLVQVEVERALVDFQAQWRAANLKRESLAARLGRAIVLIVAVPDTSSVRKRLEPHEELISRAMPTSSRDLWRALRGCQPIDADGLLFVRAREPPKHQPGLAIASADV